jgi:hypothetical protein
MQAVHATQSRSAATPSPGSPSVLDAARLPQRKRCRSAWFSDAGVLIRDQLIDVLE